MGSIDNFNCGCIESSGLERLRYFPRQLLTADDMRAEQEYFREKQRRHNRLLHGTGTVCGLEVMADPEAGPLAVKVCPGYALGPQGDEIYVAEPAPLDLSECAHPAPAPCTPAAAPMAALGPLALVVQIRYVECLTRPARTLPAGCGCDESACEYSRLRDGFALRCVRALLASEPAEQPGICSLEKKPLKPQPCRPCPDDPWLTLARVTLNTDAAGGAAMGPAAINNTVRKVLYPSGQMQAQLIASCCA